MVRMGRIDASCGFDINYGTRGSAFDSFNYIPPEKEEPKGGKRGRPAKKSSTVSRNTPVPPAEAIQGGSDLPEVEI